MSIREHHQCMRSNTRGSITDDKREKILHSDANGGGGQERPTSIHSVLHADFLLPVSLSPLSTILKPKIKPFLNLPQNESTVK